MKKIILLITASLMFLTAEDVKIKSAGTDADDGVVFKNSIDSTLVDIDGTGVAVSYTHLTLKTIYSV